MVFPNPRIESHAAEWFTVRPSPPRKKVLAFDFAQCSTPICWQKILQAANREEIIAKFLRHWAVQNEFN
jgi:hypothetical protein